MFIEEATPKYLTDVDMHTEVGAFTAEPANCIRPADMMTTQLVVMDKLWEMVEKSCLRSIERCHETTRPFREIDAALLILQSEMMDGVFFNSFLKEVEQGVKGNYFIAYSAQTMIDLMQGQIREGDDNERLRNATSWDDIIHYINVYLSRAEICIAALRKSYEDGRKIDHGLGTIQIILEQDTPVLEDKIKIMTGVL